MREHPGPPARRKFPRHRQNDINPCFAKSEEAKGRGRGDDACGGGHQAHLSHPSLCRRSAQRENIKLGGREGFL